MKIIESSHVFRDITTQVYIIAFLLCAVLPLGKAQNTPNVILILADDQGWNGTSVQLDGNEIGSKSDYYRTPNLERLAQQGIRFSQAYAPAPKCSPTRNSILTGQTTASSQFTNTARRGPDDELLITPDVTTSIRIEKTTFPELIKQIRPEYMTGHYGKWHLGSDGPENNGFDRSDGNTGNQEGDQGGLFQDDPKRIFSITDSAMVFISDAVEADRPFYLQLSHYATHSPLEAQSATLDLYFDEGERPVGNTHTNGDFGAMTEDLDTGVGMILDFLDNQGITDSTYVIYLSDNGAQNGVSPNRPLRRGKTFLYEGGIRVPMMVSGPGIPKNMENETAIVGYDLYPTIVEWITGDVSAVPLNVEGGSFASNLTSGGLAEVVRDNALIFHSPHYDMNPAKTPRSAIIRDNYKFIVDYETGTFSLFDLDSDIGESVNLLSSEQELANEMCLELRNYLKNNQAAMPSLNSDHANYSGTASDADEDGLPDEWEFRELLTTRYNGDDDPDMDGSTNAEEFEAGTDPYGLSEQEPSDECRSELVFAEMQFNAVCFDTIDAVFYAYSNGLADHPIGDFPRPGNPNRISAQENSFTMCFYPSMAEEITNVATNTGPGTCVAYIFGIGVNGLLLDPWAAEWFTNPNTGEENRDWNEDAVSDLVNLGLDFNNAHVQPSGQYHYHGEPIGLIDNLNITATAHSPIVGYAADGFPIYYKYVYANPNDISSGIVEAQSCHQLKAGNRPGDGVTAPNGPYDGRYTADYEWVEGNDCRLDECNGRFGITPDFPEGTYYYVLTATYPVIPRCFTGKPDNSFAVGPARLGCGISSALEDCTLPTTVEELIQAEDMKVILYPNPANRVIYLNFEKVSSQDRINSILIYDLQGKVHYQSKRIISEIRSDELSPGVYFVQINYDQGQVTKKIVIK